MRLHYNGAGTSGTGMKLVNYLPGISSVYFAAVGVVGGLYVCNPSSLKVDILLKINLELICTNAVKLPVYTSSN